ncbi:ATP-binding protein [Actinokineospora sp. 24-640]
MTTDTGLHIESRALQDAIVVEPVGVLEVATYALMRDYLLKCAVDEPEMIIVDLAGVTVTTSASLVVFSAVAAQIAEWPGAPLRLVSAPGAPVPVDSPIRRFVSVHASVADALAAGDQAPTRRVIRIALPNDFSALSAARTFVGRTCLDWDVPDQLADAKLIASELVENTLQHTMSAPTLRLELRREVLTVAVYDTSPVPAELVATPRPSERQLGMTLVARLSAVWGCTPTRQGGKVVWATLRAPRP